MYFGSEDLRESHPHLISKQLLSTSFCQPILPRESSRGKHPRGSKTVSQQTPEKTSCDFRVRGNISKGTVSTCQVLNVSEFPPASSPLELPPQGRGSHPPGGWDMSNAQWPHTGRAAIKAELDETWTLLALLPPCLGALKRFCYHWALRGVSTSSAESGTDVPKDTDSFCFELSSNKQN